MSDFNRCFKSMYCFFFTFFVHFANSQPSPIVDNINWLDYLSRHDPIWNSTITCYTGYTLLEDTIKHESADGCEAIPCVSPGETCVEVSAAICDACETCTSFGLCSEWHNGTLAQLFGNNTPYISNTAGTHLSKVVLCFEITHNAKHMENH